MSICGPVSPPHNFEINWTVVILVETAIKSIGQ
jgi:hypothetical protein